MAKGLAAAGLAAALLSAQAQQPPKATFRSRADLVQVGVVVVDPSGNPVRGLRAGDFMLRDRGTTQTIASFDEVSRPAPAAAPADAPPSLVRKDVSTNQTAQADRLVVIVVDDLHIYRERTDRAREIARKVLDDLGSAASMAVLFTSGEHSTQVTDDRARLAAAVDTLKGRQSSRRPHPAIDEQTGAAISPEESMESALAKVQRNQDTKVRDFFDNISQYKVLQDAARLLGGSDPRRKAFVLISEGVGKNLSGLFGAMAPEGDAPEGGQEYASGNVAALARQGPRSYHDFALIDMMESMRRSNVATYAIDPRGKVDSKDLARECFPPPAPPPGRIVDDPCSHGLTDWNSVVRQAQHGLQIMSEASGGFAVTNTDDFTSGVKRIVDDLDHYYLLGFYPSDTKGKNYRRLDVTVPGRPDLRLRFRRGYLPGGPPPPPRNANPLVALSAGVLPSAGLPLRLGAIALPGTGQTSRVALVLEVSVPRARLQEQDGRLHDTLKYEVLVVDEKKAKVRSLAGLEAALTLSVNASAGTLPDAATYQVAEIVDVPPGRYEFRVGATSARLGAGGSVYLPVEVPDAGTTPVLGGLLLGYADGPRVPVAPRRVTPAQREALAAAIPFAPSLDRTFTARDALLVYAEGIVRGGVRPTVSVDVVDAAGHVVRSPSPSFATGASVRIESRIALEGLSAGSYILRATLADGTRSAVREVGFAVR